jgi:hypothetical protein
VDYSTDFSLLESRAVTTRQAFGIHLPSPTPFQEIIAFPFSTHVCVEYKKKTFVRPVLRLRLWPKRHVPLRNTQCMRLRWCTCGGFFNFAKQFKYRGSITDFSLTSDMLTIESRRPHQHLARSRTSSATSPYVCVQKVGTTVFWSWPFFYHFFNRLRYFHNRCVRSMCRITMAHTIKYRITPKSLIERLGVGSFDSYYKRNLLLGRSRRTHSFRSDAAHASYLLG